MLRSLVGSEMCIRDRSKIFTSSSRNPTDSMFCRIIAVESSTPVLIKICPSFDVIRNTAKSYVPTAYRLPITRCPGKGRVQLLFWAVRTAANDIANPNATLKRNTDDFMSVILTRSPTNTKPHVRPRWQSFLVPVHSASLYLWRNVLLFVTIQ